MYIVVGNYYEARVIRPEVGLAVAIQLDYSRNPSKESLLRKKSHQQASSYINYSELQSCTILFSVVLSHGTRARVSLVHIEPLLQVRQGELVSGLVLAIAGAPPLNSVVGEVNKLTAAMWHDREIGGGGGLSFSCSQNIGKIWNGKKAALLQVAGGSV